MTAANRDPAWGGSGGGSPAVVPPTSSIDDFAVVGNLFVRGGSPWVDVKAEGAKGDNLTDDTAAIQAAIDKAATIAGGGTVFIPNGQYKVTSLSKTTASANQVINIIGESKEGSILVKSGADANPVLSLDNTSYDTHGTLSDFRISGNGTCTGLKLNRTAYMSMIRLDIRSCAIGVDCTGVERDIFWSCYFGANGTAIKMRNEVGGAGYQPQIDRIQNCKFEANTSLGIDYGGQGALLVVDHCDFIHNGTTADQTTGSIYIQATVDDSFVAPIKVRDSWFEANHGWDVQAYGGNVTLESNYHFSAESSRCAKLDGCAVARLLNLDTNLPSGICWTITANTLFALVSGLNQTQSISNSAQHRIGLGNRITGDFADFFELSAHGGDVSVADASCVRLFSKLDGGSKGVLSARFPTGAVVPLATEVGDYGTSLPANPVDGQQFTLVDSLTVPTYSWRLRYNAGSANTDKWEFVGGTPATVAVITQETTASTTYAALATAGPSFALPRAGVYVVEVGAYLRTNTIGAVALMGYDIGATGAVDADAVEFDTAVANNGIHCHRRLQKTGLTAVTLTAKYRASAGTGTYRDRTLAVTPVRLS